MVRQQRRDLRNKLRGKGSSEKRDAFDNITHFAVAARQRDTTIFA
jgi:hypothetical protein